MDTSTLALTLTLRDVSDLEDGFDRLKRVRSLWESKIKNFVSGFITATELTNRSPLWHWHLHSVIWGTQVEAEFLIQSWIDCAAALGIVASRSGQDFALKTAEKALSYAVKARLGHGPHSLGDTLTPASHGDADAADRWAQLENFQLVRGRRMRSSWQGKPAPTRTTPATFDYDRSPDLRRLTLLDYLGVSGRSEQSKIMILAGHTVSTATISRMRRHPRMQARYALR